MSGTDDILFQAFQSTRARRATVRDALRELIEAFQSTRARGARHDISYPGVAGTKKKA